MEHHLQKYGAYRIEDFLNDDLFIRWAQYPDDENRLLWDEVGRHFPQQQEAMGAAREWAVALGNLQSADAAHRRELVWEQILAARGEDRGAIIRPFVRRWRAVAAAVVAACIVLLGGFLWYNNTSRLEQTDFATTETVRLPDGSELMLNRNSSVTYARRWGASRPRDVSMTGEVDFIVRHVATPGRQLAADSFRVNVGELRVTVLGTAFNIRSRRGKTAVSLREGSLRIDFINQQRPSILLHSGEAYVYDAVNDQAAAQKSNVDAAAAWKKNNLVLEGTSFSDIVAILEDDYGFTVEVRDPSLLNRKLRGEVPMKEIGNLFFILENILDANIDQKRDTLIITTR